MALLRRQSKASGAIPTSSMADIAFLLLVFFLTTTVFDEEKGLQVVLPEKGPESEQEVSPKNLLFLMIQPDGSIQVKAGESQQVRTVNYRMIEGLMRQALTSNPNVIAAIQTSPRARYVDMIRVLDGVQSAGATRFSLQPLQE